MDIRELLDTAKEHVAAVVGKQVEAVSGINRNGDDAWTVAVEVLELERVPNTMDILATYEVKLSDDGELLGFQRGRRYHRAAQEDGRD